MKNKGIVLKFGVKDERILANKPLPAKIFDYILLRLCAV